MDGTIYGLDANAAMNIANQNGGQMMLNPQQQADLARQQAMKDAQFNQNMAQQNAVFSGQQANQAANLNTQRAMALNAQANAAQNVANQLNQLSSARQTNAGLIQGAMQTAAGLYR